MGPINYAQDEDGKLLPLVLCKEQYKKSSTEPVADVYDIDSEVETGEKGSLAFFVRLQRFQSLSTHTWVFKKKKKMKGEKKP